MHARRSGFDALLANDDLGAYNALCARVAAAFANISAEVNAAGASLREAGRSDLFDAVRTLQQHEKEQLRLVRHVALRLCAVSCACVTRGGAGGDAAGSAQGARGGQVELAAERRRVPRRRRAA